MYFILQPIYTRFTKVLNKLILAIDTFIVNLSVVSEVLCLNIPSLFLAKCFIEPYDLTK